MTQQGEGMGVGNGVELLAGLMLLPAAIVHA